MKLKSTILKSTLLGVALTSSLTNSAFAGGPDYYQGKGRIAVSSDGNKHDNDDMLATKLTLMILAKAGLQDATKLYTYADHVWGNESNDLDIMRISAEITGRRFGFTKSKFFAAVENKNNAYKFMSQEIQKSTADDPLFIAAAGPMQVVGEALNRANKNNPEALNHVTVVSHSPWNDNHSDKPSNASDEHSGWTWDEMVEAFGDKVNFKHIANQNGKKTPDGGFKNRFSTKTWKDWDWMAQHKDPNIQWVRNNTGIKCRPDYSDAGLVYYLCADLDGVRGDENGDVEKLRRWIGSEPIATGVAPSPTEYIAFDAEDAVIPEGGSWCVRYEGDEKYNQIFGMAPVSNGAYLECVGGPITGGGVKGGVDVISYKFTPKTSGKYFLSARVAQQLHQDGKVVATDLCNDIYVKMDGDFESGNEAPLEALKSWQKYYGRGFNAWGSFNNIEVHHKHIKPVYELKAGEEYTLSISARSKGVCIDYFALTKEPIGVVAKQDIAFTHPYAVPAPSAMVYNSVDFEKFGGWRGDEYVDATIDSNNNVLQIADRLRTAIAETTFRGEKGEYNIVINTMLEGDGESTFVLYIGKKKIGEVINPRIHATKIKDYTVKTLALTEKPVKVKKGDKIRVEFCSATNGLVPEGKTTATSRGRWRSIRFEK